MFPFVLVCEEELGVRTGCPVGTNCETKQTHEIRLSGWLVMLEASIWHVSWRPVKPLDGPHLEYLQIQRQRIRTKSPTTKQRSSSNQYALHPAAWKRNGLGLTGEN